MANRIKELFESIVYMGMKPGARATVAPPAAKPGLLGLFNRFRSGPAHSDPLYLTNQTFAQKLQRAVIVSIPVVVVGGLAFLGIGYYAAKHPKTVKVVTRQETEALILPNFNDHIKLEANKYLEVTEVRFEHSGGTQMFGSLRNISDQVIDQAVVVFDLTDDDGSQLGGVTVTETNLTPGSVRNFRRPIEQPTAEHAVVREVHPQ